MVVLLICIVGGLIVVSYVNDVGFWLFGKFIGVIEVEMLKIWIMMEIIFGIVGVIVGMIVF